MAGSTLSGMPRWRRSTRSSGAFQVPGAIVAGALAVAACKDGDAVATSSAPVREVALDPQLRPALGAVVSRPDAPPPISGGTLAVSKTSRLAVASDPDRDRVYVVDLSARAVRHSVQLAPRTEPGRVALDEAGHAFIALRRSGELATVDLATAVVSVQPACVAPRGVAWDRWRNRVVVACASGNIMALPPLGGAASAVGGRLGLDLRDIVVRKDGIDVSTFRSAELHSFQPDGSAGLFTDPSLGDANLAWRVRELGNEDGEVLDVVVAQDPSSETVSVEPGGYGQSALSGKCTMGVGIVSTRLSLVKTRCVQDPLTCAADSLRLPTAVLPVDVATNSREIVVLGAGNALTPALSQLFVISTGDLRGGGRQECGVPVRGGDVAQGQVVAADFSSLDELVVQTREPAQLHIMTDDRLRTFKTIDLATDSRADTGHTIFHANAGGFIACASCHAEGADDGRVWRFEDIGPRRTPSLLGTTAHTEPFHWSGEMRDLSALVDHVFVERMSGPRLDPPAVDALGKYLFALPAPVPLRGQLDIAPRGRELFEKKCAVCHSGAMMTNNLSLDVGTGGKFQVPSLVGVAWHGPWIHNGCADTLFDRFNPACGGRTHAEIDDLTAADRAFLVEYMESL